MDVTELEGLRRELDDFVGEFRDCFRTRPSRENLAVYMRGQLGPLPRKSVEPIALDAGVVPRTLQQFLSVHRWDAGEYAQRVREIIIRDHADTEAIGVIDETSFAKKGDKTVGVQRQYCGSTGKLDNCVVTVHMSYVTRDISTLADQDLYLPEDWFADDELRAEGQVPADLAFRTKWQIALDLLRRSRAEGLPLRWLTADEGYGQVPAFLEGAAQLGLLYVVEVPRSVKGWTPAGKRVGRKLRRVEGIWRRGGPAWQTYLVKDTTKGPVVWEARETRFVPSWAAGDPRQFHRLIVAEEPLTGEIKYFLTNAPMRIDLGDLMTVAFSRWHVERHFEDSKQEIGLGHFEVRSYKSIQRHLAISLGTLLFLNRAKRRLEGEKRWWPRLDVVASEACCGSPA